MRFRLQTDYALKAILFLAIRGESNSTTEEIAQYYDISAAHLGRVIRRLQRYGYVKAIRGRRGGVRLDRDPTTLTVGEIVETLEEGGSLAEPTNGELPEAADQAAPMRAALRRAKGLFTSYLEGVTLAALAAEGRGQAAAPDSGTGSAGTSLGDGDPARATGDEQEPQATGVRLHEPSGS